MAGVSIPRELRDALDLHDDTPDANAFAMALFRKGKNTIRTLHNRAVARSGLRSVVVNDGPRRKRVKLYSPAGDTPAKLAARFAVLASRRAPLILDEAARMAVGLPPGPRGLDETIDPRLVQAHSGAARHLLDPLTLSIAIPILVALIPVVLPMLLQWGGDAAETIGAAVVGAAGGAVEETEGAAPEPELWGFPRSHVLLAGVVVVAAVVAFR
jgi:hypothetical protein